MKRGVDDEGSSSGNGSIDPSFATPMGTVALSSGQKVHILPPSGVRGGRVRILFVPTIWGGGVATAVMICSCSDETPCHIGDGGNSISNGVCHLIDDVALTATRSALASAASSTIVESALIRSAVASAASLTIALIATQSAAALAASLT
jgi:hypothetical protein